MINLIPLSNANLERMFSLMKLIKNDIRNRMDIETLSFILECKSYYE